MSLRTQHPAKLVEDPRHEVAGDGERPKNTVDGAGLLSQTGHGDGQSRVSLWPGNFLIRMGSRLLADCPHATIPKPCMGRSSRILVRCGSTRTARTNRLAGAIDRRLCKVWLRRSESRSESVQLHIPSISNDHPRTPLAQRSKQTDLGTKRKHFQNDLSPCLVIITHVAIRENRFG